MSTRVNLGLFVWDDDLCHKVLNGLCYCQLLLNFISSLDWNYLALLNFSSSIFSIQVYGTNFLKVMIDLSHDQIDGFSQSVKTSMLIYQSDQVEALLFNPMSSQDRYPR
jgi:hypothetical protein